MKQETYAAVIAKTIEVIVKQLETIDGRIKPLNELQNKIDTFVRDHLSLAWNSWIYKSDCLETQNEAPQRS